MDIRIDSHWTLVQHEEAVTYRAGQAMRQSHTEGQQWLLRSVHQIVS